LVIFSVFVCGTVKAVSPVRRDTAAVIESRYGDFKENCFPRPSGGCNCNEKDQTGSEQVKKYDTDGDCKLPVEIQTVINKIVVNDEIRQRFGDFKADCFPKPSGGCSCNERDVNGTEMVAKYDKDEQCKVPLDVVVNRIHVNEEIKEKFGDFKENCFPKPSGGCRCNERDSNGTEVEKKYDTDVECKVPMATFRMKRNQPSQNVRDPVREKAQQNYQAVLNELNEKFKGLKEGCYPRPKGCLCVIGKDANGRDLTERRMKDSDCKCREGDRSPGCPVAGA